MIEDLKTFKQCIKNILLSDDGLSVESEGTVYIRSLEGDQIASGIWDDEGSIESEILFNDRIDDAIEYFISERERLNHGSEW